MGLGAIIAIDNEPQEDLMASGLVGSIEVYERLGETTYYTINFSCDIADEDISLLGDSRISPGAELMIIIASDDVNECLVRGPVFSHDINLSNGGDGSSVMVKGADNTLQMDREFKSVITEGTDSEAVTTIASDYFDETLKTTETSSTHPEDKHTLIQRGTDLQFVRKLARRNGYKFWIAYDEEGKETPHFDRPDLDSDPVAELIINRQDYNINSLQISWDSHRPSVAQGLQLDFADKSNIEGSVTEAPHTLLGSTSQQDFASDAVTIDLSAPVDDSGELNARLEAAMIEANFFVNASCQTSMQQLGKSVRAGTLVTVTGAGTQHSGTYLVAAVKHMIDESAHTMDIELIRNAVGPSEE